MWFWLSSIKSFSVSRQIHTWRNFGLIAAFTFRLIWPLAYRGSTLLPFRMLTRSTPQRTLIGQSGVEAHRHTHEVIESLRPLGRPSSTLGKEVTMKTVVLQHHGLCPRPKVSHQQNLICFEEWCGYEIKKKVMGHLFFSLMFGYFSL